LHCVARIQPRTDFAGKARASMPLAMTGFRFCQ
jgi:hypothetical protein